jgi:hypothetical protein
VRNELSRCSKCRTLWNRDVNDALYIHHVAESNILNKWSIYAKIGFAKTYALNVAHIKIKPYSATHGEKEISTILIGVVYF